MKHARKALTILFLFVTPLLLSGIITTIPDGKVMTPKSQIPIKNSVLSYETHSPITIIGDEEFHNVSSNESWMGDGSPSAPYIIEGYNITSDVDCIFVADVTVSFEIRDCYLTSVAGIAGQGVVIFNATDATIADSVFVNKEIGVMIDRGPAVFIDNCSITAASNGIMASRSTGMTIQGCTIHDIFDTGIIFIECNSTTLSDNEIYDTMIGAGVRYDLSHFVSITGNQIFDCGASGIWAVFSPYSTIENNIIHDNWYSFGPPVCGIHLDQSGHASIIGNEIYDNARNGIFVIGCEWVYIFDNDIYGNSDHGIDVMFSTNGTIHQNNIHSNGWWPQIINDLCGIYLGPTIDFVISDNMIWNNTPSGISFDAADRVEVTNNEIFDNTDVGMYMFGPGYGELWIFGNEIYDNGFLDLAPPSEGGLHLIGYSDCIIQENQVYNNIGKGIAIQGDSNTVIGNEVYNTTGEGIEVVMVWDCLVSGNTAYDNEVGIFAYSIATNITDNIVYDNEVGIYLYGSQFCMVSGNDVGWNGNNSLEESTSLNNIWYNNDTHVGNWWSDYDGVGAYDINNGTHTVTQDLYPSKSLDLVKPASIDYEILETGNTIIWVASALNPSHYEVFVDDSLVWSGPWDGGDIEYLADGLSHGMHTIELEIYHISGHSIGNSTSADVEDLTPPEIDGPSTIEASYGGFFDVQYTAEDPSGLGQWTVNDTTNFAIDSAGHLTNIASLPVGEHIVRISISDTHGHTAFLDVTIMVLAGPGLPTPLALAIGGGVIGVLVVIVVILKKTEP